jgi:GNAT superfamily N-acetyltransferase
MITWHCQATKKKKAFPQSKHLRYYPAVKIARLGVSSDFTRLGIGSEIIEFLKVFFIIRNKTGCRYITVDAYNNQKTIKFYEKNGFALFTQEDANKQTRTMYFDLLPLYKKLKENREVSNEIEEAMRSILN